MGDHQITDGPPVSRRSNIVEIGKVAATVFLAFKLLLYTGEKLCQFFSENDDRTDSGADNDYRCDNFKNDFKILHIHPSYNNITILHQTLDKHNTIIAQTLRCLVISSFIFKASSAAASLKSSPFLPVFIQAQITARDEFMIAPIPRSSNAPAASLAVPP